MGVEVKVTSSLGKGTIFSFYISTDIGHNSIPSMPSIDVSNKKVLIVDDHVINIEILKSQLVAWKMDVTTANNVLTAISICQDKIKKHNAPPFDIMITDKGMPDIL